MGFNFHALICGAFKGMKWTITNNYIFHKAETWNRIVKFTHLKHNFSSWETIRYVTGVILKTIGNIRNKLLNPVNMKHKPFMYIYKVWLQILRDFGFATTFLTIEIYEYRTVSLIYKNRIMWLNQQRSKKFISNILCSG